MSKLQHHAFLLSMDALEDLLKRDLEVFVPEDKELYREVGGNWHMVERDYPIIYYGGREDTRLHVFDAVLNLFPEEDLESYLVNLKNKFAGVFLVDDTRYSLFKEIELDSKSLGAIGRQLHLGNLVVHYRQAQHGLRRQKNTEASRTIC